MKEKVFICYRRKDNKDLVEHLSDKLKRRFKVTYDRDLNTCNDVEKKIDELINDCSYFVVILDANTLDFSTEKERDDRKWIIHELAYVLGNKNAKKIIPILTNGCKMDDGIIKLPIDEMSLELRNEDEKYLEEIERIKNISKINAIEYSDGETLKQFLPRLLDFMKVKSFFERHRTGLFIIISIFILIIGIVAGMILKQNIIYSRNKEIPTVVFAGGGSVTNMIKDITNDSVDIKNYDNSLYLDLPSENAWPLLAEEVMINHTSDNVANKFYPVCLSAEEAKEDDFCKLIDQEKFKSKGTVVSYKLGYDTLIVYTTLSNIKEEKRIFTSELSKLVKCLIVDGDLNEYNRIYNTISMDRLSELIKAIKENNKDATKNKLYIYCTQEGSGTYSCYREKLKDKGIDITKDSMGETLKWYDQKYALPAFNETEFYIILSSIYYSPDELDTNVVENGIFVTSNNDSVVICKPMYLYFAGYRSDENAPLNLPQEMTVLLKELVQRDSSLMKYVDGIGMEMYYEKSDVITPFEDMLKYSSIKRKKK